jgi:hypothetical protein
VSDRLGPEEVLTNGEARQLHCAPEDEAHLVRDKDDAPLIVEDERPVASILQRSRHVGELGSSGRAYDSSVPSGIAAR